jgi:SpoVK/Ycf46/Vps4 family AAA+-type ATPase
MRGSGSDSHLIATALDCTAIAVCAVLTLQLFRKLDGLGGRSATTPKEASAKVKALAAKLKGRARDGNPLKVSLKEHELEVATDVVAPDEIEVTFEQIGGLAAIGKALQRNVILPFRRPELFKQSSLLKPPKGILLHGPPGTGKTLLARAVAREAGFTFIALNPARLLSKWYGESNKLCDAYFSLAHKLAPTIIFIDEIDCLFRHRGGAGAGGGHEHEATSMLKAQFLSLWDGLLTSSTTQVVVIAATNCPDGVDPAVLRRLPLSYQIDLPALEGRLDVLRLLLKNEPLAKDVDLQAIAEATEGYSGSDLDQLCKTAAFRALEDALEREAAEEKKDGPAEGGAGATSSAPETPVAPGGDAGPTIAATREGGITAGSASGEATPPPALPPLSLRQLTIHDFLAAREVVRPTRGRFAGVTHDVHHAASTLPPTESYDPDLYD